MKELLTHEKGELINYFGVPRLDYAELSVFDRSGGIIAVIFHRDKAICYAAYKKSKELVKMEPLEPIFIAPEKFDNFLEKSIEEFTDTYGNPHCDLGNGFYIPAYLSDHASVYSISINPSGIIRRISEFSLLEPV